MNSLEKNITALEGRLRETRENGQAVERIDRERFATIRAYFRLISSVSLKNIKEGSRNCMKGFLERGVEIEAFFAQRQDSAFSIKSDLLLFVNKLSNSQVWEYICDVLSKEREFVFGLIYEFVRHPSSFALRERLCREEWLIPKCCLLQERREKPATGEVLRWNLLLQQICRRCPYFLADTNKFHGLFLDFEKVAAECLKGEDPVLAEFRDNHMEILGYYLSVNHRELEVRNLYVKTFLQEKCYNLYRRLTPLLNSLENETDIRFFLKSTTEGLKSTFGRSPGERTHTTLQNIVNFLVMKVAIKALDRIKDKNMDNELIACLLQASESNGPGTRSEDLIGFLNLVIGALVRLPLDFNIPIHKEFREKFLKFCWNNIVYPKDSNKVVKNLSKLVISLMIGKYDVFRELNQRDKSMQLYDYILSEHDDIHDEDSGNIWFECLKNLIPVCTDSGHDCLKAFLFLHEFPKDFFSITNQISVQNRFWQVISLLRNSFKDKFFWIVENKFFKDIGLSNHNLFDIILIMLVYYAKGQESRLNSSLNSSRQDGNESPGRRIFFTRERRNFIFDKLISVLRSEQETSKNYIDKFYHLTIIFMKLFEDATISPPALKELLQPLRLEEIQREVSLTVTRTLKSQTYFLSLLNLMIQRAEENQKRPLCNEIINYLLSSKIVQNNNAYLCYSQLFPVFYNLLKLCIKYYDNFGELINKANHHLKETTEKKVYSVIFFSLLIYHFIFEKADELKEIKIVNIDYFISMFLNYLIRKKNKQKTTFLSFEEIFELSDNRPAKEYNVLLYYKFFVLLMLKLLIALYKTQERESDFANIVKVYENIFKKLTNPDYELKYQALRLLECLIVPEDVTDKDMMLFRIFGLDHEKQLRLVNAATMESNVCLKESNNAQFQQIFYKYYSIVVRFFVKRPVSENLGEFWRYTISNNFALLDDDYRRQFVRKVERLEGTSLFERLSFFFKHSDFASKNVKNLNIENNELFVNIAVFYCRLFEERTRHGDIKLTINDQSVGNCNALFSSFIGLQEIEGSDSFFAFDITKFIIRSELEMLNEVQKQSFIVNTLDLLVNQKTVTHVDINMFLEIFGEMYPKFFASDFFCTFANKNNKILRIFENYDFSVQPFITSKKTIADAGQSDQMLIEDATETETNSVSKDERALVTAALFQTQLGERFIAQSGKNFRFGKTCKANIMLKNHMYEDALAELEKSIKEANEERVKTFNSEDEFSLESKIASRQVADMWVEAKRNLNAWGELQTLSDFTERK